MVRTEDSARPRSNVSDIKPIRFRGCTSPNRSISHSVLKIPIRNSGSDTELRHGAHPLLLSLGLLREEEGINDHFIQRIGRIPYLFSDFFVRTAIVTFSLFFNLFICLRYLLPAIPAVPQPLPTDRKSPFFRIRKSGLLPSEFPGLTHQSLLFRRQKSLVSRLTQKLHDRPHPQFHL